MVVHVQLIFIFLLCIFDKARLNVEECGVLKNENRSAWNVAIYKEARSNNLELVCLGTAIKNNIIVTAAHCLYDQSGKVKNEEFYVSSKQRDKLAKNNKNFQKVQKGNIFIHHAFKGDVKRGNVAVVGLQTNLKNAEFVPICIDWDNTRPLLHDGEPLKQSSWQNGNLKMIDVSYVDYEHCQYVASNSFKKLLTNDKICAKTGKEFMGEIDDGAGLVYLDLINNLWYIRGVVSAHDPEKTNLVTYSDIIFYLTWLSDICVRF